MKNRGSYMLLSAASLSAGTLALTRGGVGAWFLLAASASLLMYAVVLPLFVLKSLSAEHRMAYPACRAGDPMAFALQLSYSGLLPLLWLVVQVSWLHESSGQLVRYRKLLFPGFRRSTTLHYRLTGLWRGHYRLQSVQAATGDLFGFTVKVKKIEPSLGFVVYPRPSSLDRPVLQLRPQDDGAPLTAALRTSSPSSDGIRPYADGDSFRRVHWRASARLNRLVVKETERLAGVKQMLLLDAGSAAVPPKCVPTARGKGGADAKASARGKGGAEAGMDAKASARRKGGAGVGMDAQAYARGKGGAGAGMDAQAYARSKGGAEAGMDAQAYARGKGGAGAGMDAKASVRSKGGAEAEMEAKAVGSGDVEQTRALLEKRVALAAGLLEAAAGARTSCGFACSSAHPRRIPPAIRPDLTLAYETLASVGGSAAAPFAEWVREEAAALPPDTSMLLLTSTLDGLLLSAIAEARSRRRDVHVIYVHGRSTLPLAEREGAAQLQALGCGFTEVPHPRSEWPQPGGVADATA
ncbi:DUF58 domain-containing protein [Paenibacillus athensensis]|uniref:DUF58 domain-containing protein n=1 Tax=Paenibacillus athensensis TaxID=1967502 RepID=A0A4Y8PR26_9BACL|nr:DUF58 domain-containing protein [Paenibacillus athensensis]MCD1258808.1 DUF58 domain-containing protein [Paenibacillus athensensis]